MSKIMGIDPALACIGYGVLDLDHDNVVTLLEYDVFETPPKTAEGSRLKLIRSWLDTFLEVRQPQLVVLERPIFKGAMAYNSLPLGMAYGVIVEACARAFVPLKEYFPRDVKYTITGNTLAKKPQMRAAVSERLAVPLLKGKDDGIDGVAVALTHVLKMAKDAEEVARVAH